MKTLFPILCGLGLGCLLPLAAPAQVITNQPQSVTVNNASSATFSVGASNAISYQWQFNSTNLMNSAYISGATNPVLTLEDVNSNQAGSYTVIVNGSLNSSPAVLSIVPGTIVTFTLTGLLTNSTVTNFMNVQLFDHDKPATVQNFLHYIHAGGYTNMFFDRCIPGFVLQGGDFGASNRTATSAPLTGWFIDTQFTQSTNQPVPSYPSEINSEFNVGPIIHNRFGTMAMALQSGNPNSANSAFFFNLADNSSNLDSQNGGFTVFGRILDANGTNLLEYFNSLTNNNGICTLDTIIFNNGADSNQLPNLPVDYIGPSLAANSNLVFCAFSFLAPPPSPSFAITNLSEADLLTNGLEGTASEDTTLGLIQCVLIPQAADGAYPYPYTNAAPQTNAAQGTTNWSLSLSPGTYTINVQAISGAGYYSPATNLTVTETAILINGPGTVTYTEQGFTNLNAVGYPFQDYQQYTVTAVPDTNQLFLNWTLGEQTAIISTIAFDMSEGTVLNANFISNGIPNSLAFTYPASNGIIATNAFNITGSISNVTATPVTVVCRIYSTSTYEEVGEPLTNSGTTDWSVNAGSLAPDSYAVQVLATDAQGNQTAVTESFTVATNSALRLNVAGSGTISGATNKEEFLDGTTVQVTAVPNADEAFYTWTTEEGLSIFQTQTNAMAPGLDLTATFVTNNISNLIAFTFPPSNAIISPGAIPFEGTISNAGYDVVFMNFLVFSQTNGLEVGEPEPFQGKGTWSTGMDIFEQGSYTILALGTDESGASQLISESFTVSSNIPLRLDIVGPGTVSPVTNGQLITTGSNFQVTATPNAGQVFYAWSSNGANYSLEPVQNYTMSDGLTLTALFVTNNDSNLISFTSPLSNGLVGTNGFNVTGSASNSTGTLMSVTCQIFSQSNLLSVSPLMQTQVMNNWTIAMPALPIGAYIAVATAADAAGHGTLIREEFSTAAAANLQLLIKGGGSVSPVTNGQTLPLGTNFLVTATPSPGEVFYAWSDGTTLSTNATQTYTMEGGLTLTATFVSTNTERGISFVSPSANGRVSTNNFAVKGKISPGMKNSQVTCQFFQTGGLGIGPPLTTTGVDSWSVKVTDLPPGNYVVEAQATNAAGKSTLISENITVLPFAIAQGTYRGLFICTNAPVSPTNSGTLTFSVTPSGVMTGTMNFPAYPPVPIYPVLFENQDYDTGITELHLDNFHGQPLNVELDVDLMGGIDYAYGVVAASSWTSELVCYRAGGALSTDTVPPVGRYMLSLQPDGETNAPSTNGYAALTVGRDGVVTYSGALPDNASFLQSARISGDGVWPFLAIPAGVNKKEILVGWEAFNTQGGCSGQLYWYRAPNLGQYYSAGVGLLTNMPVNASGSNFVKPEPGGVYSIVLAGGALASPLTNALTVGSTGQFAVTGGASDKLKVSVSAAGVISGSLLNPSNEKTLNFRGGFMTPTLGGSGFISGPQGQVGYFTVTPAPP